MYARMEVEKRRKYIITNMRLIDLPPIRMKRFASFLLWVRQRPYTPESNKQFRALSLHTRLWQTFKKHHLKRF